MRALFLLALAFYAALAEDWVLRKNESGISVYTRESPKSPVDEYRAVTTVAADTQKVLELIENIEIAPKWIKYCKKGALVKKIDESRSITHTINDLPWPLDDRDAVVLNTVSKMPNKSIKVEFVARADYIPRVDGAVRIRELSGFWLIEPSGSKSRVTYQVLSNPQNLPSWMVNLGLVEQPFETLKKMRELLSQ